MVGTVSDCLSKETARRKKERRKKEGGGTVGSLSSNQYEVLYAHGIVKKLRENECRPS